VLVLCSPNSIADKKVKYINRGEYKRLSIAEEMVHGPKLLLMDEPTTGVSMYESSILMMTFREMVNVDRTVVATMYQPSAEAFRLFDSLMLLSKGRVIYSGRISGATDFFVNSPYQYFFGNYNNPADFLADISGGQISDCKVSCPPACYHSSVSYRISFPCCATLSPLLKRWCPPS
jgi:ABC-type multidrug transport system ATPase subunit